MLNIALPTGRLSKKAYALFESIGYGCPEFLGDNRKLVFENDEGQIRYLLVKPSDVSIYVEHGVADIGVVGKDVLLETEPELYELLDMQIGKCTVSIAAPDGYVENPDAVLRVATKYPNITARYYAGINRQIEIIKLNGSIELAPILGLSDVIVDIVETGTTLRENKLSVIKSIADISSRLIANKSAYHFKGADIDALTDGLRAAVLGVKA